MSLLTKTFVLSLLSGAWASLEGNALPVAPFTLPLQPIGGGANLARRQVAAADHESPMKLSSGGWSTPVQIGGKTFNLAVSTQDADTWVVSDQVKCTNPPGTPANYPQPPCKFGAKYKIGGTFQKFAEGPNAPIVSGLTADGIVGWDSVSVGGVTVPKQVIGVVTDTLGVDDQVSGGLGLGTSIQSDMGYAQNKAPLKYSTLIESMFASKLIPASVFSITLNGNAGTLALGGVPRVGIDPASWVSVPADQDVYAVKADGYVLDGQNAPAQLSLLIDIKSPGSYLPKRLSDAINAKIQGSKFRNTDGLYSVPCNAKASSVTGVVIGGKAFTYSPADLVTKDPDVPNACLSLIGAFNSTTEGVLGASFFKSNVGVFDPINKRIQFGRKK